MIMMIIMRYDDDLMWEDGEDNNDDHYKYNDNEDDEDNHSVNDDYDNDSDDNDNDNDDNNDDDDWYPCRLEWLKRSSMMTPSPSKRSSSVMRKSSTSCQGWFPLYRRWLPM